MLSYDDLWYNKKKAHWHEFSDADLLLKNTVP